MMTHRGYAGFLGCKSYKKRNKFIKLIMGVMPSNTKGKLKNGHLGPLINYSLRDAAFFGVQVSQKEQISS